MCGWLHTRIWLTKSGAANDGGVDDFLAVTMAVEIAYPVVCVVCHPQIYSIRTRTA